MVRLDIALPYGNALLVLHESGQFYIRLLMIVDNRRTLVTPKLPIAEADLVRLMHVKYSEVDLVEMRLSSEPGFLTVHWRNYHMPADNTIWKPLLRQFMGKVQADEMQTKQRGVTDSIAGATDTIEEP
ncbi:MAG: hypothetical protein P4L46_23795 [Fimbriimonas sp.]|nr:hypothetical protein [Fimbriimonas sp.]